MDAAWRELFDRLVELGDLRGRRVLEVGTGTGRLAAALADRAQAKVWAVDPSAEMLEQARVSVPAGVGLKQAVAEDLPFRNGWFERAVMRMTVHLLDRPPAFAELRRVLVAGGRLVVVTLDPQRFAEGWLAPFFASLVRIDQERFPVEPELVSDLRESGFDAVRVTRLPQAVERTRAEALAAVRGRAYSTFDLITDEEYRAGLARVERELPETVLHRREWLIAVAERP